MVFNLSPVVCYLVTTKHFSNISPTDLAGRRSKTTSSLSSSERGTVSWLILVIQSNDIVRNSVASPYELAMLSLDLPPLLLISNNTATIVAVLISSNNRLLLPCLPKRMLLQDLVVILARKNLLTLQSPQLEPNQQTIEVAPHQ